MYKTEDALREMFELGMISKEEYVESVCEHRNNERTNNNDIENQIEEIINACEHYANDEMAHFIALQLSGSEYEKELLQKMIRLYEHRMNLDIGSGCISSEIVKNKKSAIEIMKRTLRFFEVK